MNIRRVKNCSYISLSIIFNEQSPTGQFFHSEISTRQSRNLSETHFVLKEGHASDDRVKVGGQQRQVEGRGRRQPQHGWQADVEGQLGHGEGRQQDADLPKLPPDIEQVVPLQQKPKIRIDFLVNDGSTCPVNNVRKSQPANPSIILVYKTVPD